MDHLENQPYYQFSYSKHHALFHQHNLAKLNNKLQYSLAGKTGTAQVFGLDPEEEYIAENIEEKLRDHALFTGFAPIENPQVAIAIIVENAGSGSSIAAPLARELLDEYFIKNPVKLDTTKQIKSLYIFSAQNFFLKSENVLLLIAHLIDFIKC